MLHHIKKHLTVLALLLVLPQSLMAQPLWSDIASEQTTATPKAKQLTPNPHANSRRVSLDYVQLKSALTTANALPAGQARKSLTTAQIELPMPDGSQQVFNIVESSIMEPELAAKYPQIKTYKAVAEKDASISGRLDIGPNGFHAYLFTPSGEVFIDPVPASQQYYSYYKHDYVSSAAKEFSCGVTPQSGNTSPLAEFKSAEFVTAARTGLGEFISYRIAVAAMGEYTQAVGGGNITTTIAEITTAINRISGIYERDLAVKLLLVGNNNLIIYTNAVTDPYTDPTNHLQVLDQNQLAIDTKIGAANYDIGHVFSTDGGGLAALGAACFPSYKARGVSGRTTPTGDPFYIDIAAHEIGHQLGANHSFNGTTGSCGGVNRNAPTAFEPGSGTSIMSYAGICGAEDTASYSDAMFHAGSIAEIIAYTRTSDGNTCSAPVVESQQAPVAYAGPNYAKQDYTIPGGTAFTLTGSATDTDTVSGNLRYQWDQMDVGRFTIHNTHGLDNGSNALFRSFTPVATPVRTLPQMSTLLGTNADPYAAKAETLPTENRTLNFRLTVRDGSGGVDEADMQVTVNGNAGPFEVLQPNSSVTLNSTQLQSIQWNAACTEMAPVNCANVDILYSTDDGVSFTSLVSNTPNDGVAEVNFANAVAAKARIKIACSDNVFFDISNFDFQLSNGSGITLPATVIGGSSNCGTAQTQTITVPTTVTGTVNDTGNPEDLFKFVAGTSVYTITLSGYGNNDLDLYLLDSTGVNIVAESISDTSSTESISKVLVAGQTYYIVVNGWDTSGQDASYTLTVQEKPIPSSGGGGGMVSYYWLFMLLITPLLRRCRKPL